MLSLWRLWAAWLLPVTQDEAYYLDWARTLSWGYFDHPPAVALLGIGTNLAPGSALAGRLGTLAAATLTLLVLLRLYRSCGLRRGALLVAVVLAGTTLPGLASGVLTTTDTALALAWALALHEGLAALRKERRRWLGAGVATGLGLLSKYTMVLIGPIFLWAILWADPKALRTPWPYLGGLLALLFFAPNLVWNAHNDWLTIRFQFGHGFSIETLGAAMGETGSESGYSTADPLPAPITEDSRTESAPPVGEGNSPMGLLAAGLTDLLDFLGTQIALWGLTAIALLVVAAIRGFAELSGNKGSESSSIIPDPAAKALLVVGTLFPLAFFALVAIVSEVEPNWPAMYLLTAVPLFASLIGRAQLWVLVTAAGNLLLASVLVVHGATGDLPQSAGHRILRETRGYPELAQRLADLPGPLFADRYQVVAMTRHYVPSLGITQWPGISRPSEYLRGTIAAPITPEQIAQAGGFTLVTRWLQPPQIPGFHVSSHKSLFHCLDCGLVETPPGVDPPCPDPLHRWELLDYRDR
ncbi:MAG: ArnT family glycosyltransferase [Gammaproteobacteria bacterium]